MMLERLDFWLTIITLGALAYFVGWQEYIKPLLARLFAFLATFIPEPSERTRTEPFKAIERSEPHSKALEPETEPTEPASAGALDVRLNREDCVMVARMILHNKSAVNPTKADTVYAGCGRRKGASVSYIRCAELYDLFFKPTQEIQFPALTAQRKQVNRN